MYEKYKLEETEYFLSQMYSKVNDSKVFIYYLDAFLVTSRSVLQYLLREIKGNKEAQLWFDNLNHEYKTIKFFKEQRNFTVHERPIDSKSIVTVNYREHITVSASIEIKLYKVEKDDELILVHSGKSHTPTKESKFTNDSPTDVNFEYRFDDWPGEEDILSLCQLHLTYLKEIINNAIEKGYIK